MYRQQPFGRLNAFAQSARPQQPISAVSAVPTPKNVEVKPPTVAQTPPPAAVPPKASSKLGRPQGSQDKRRSARTRVPVVSYDIGVALDQYGNANAVLAQEKTLREVRRLIGRGYTNSSQLQVLAKPGSLGQPTVSKLDDGNVASTAEISAAPNLIGQTESTPDPLQVRQAELIAKHTSAAAVSGAVLNQGLPVSGGENAVPFSQTPVQPVALAEAEADRQVPAGRSLFRKTVGR